MTENQELKNEIRLKQAVSIVEAIIATFGEIMVLDAMAIVVRTPDGQCLLSSAADYSRAINENGPTSLPGRFETDFEI